jgi:serine/threonine protein kinase
VNKVGKYRILGKLGQGGTGSVYKALDPLLDRVVEQKTISTPSDAEPELRARVFREGHSATHLSLGRKLGIVVEVCEGFAHAHSRQVIHLDIKPANVFVTKSGEAKILDFGLTLMVATDVTRTGTRLGTPSCMSPAQVPGERVDHRTDIFSVGILLYGLLILRKPFEEDAIPATIFKILQVEPEPPQSLNPSIASELGAIVLKALAKQREDRFQTIDDPGAALLALSSSLAPSDLRGDEEETTTQSGPVEIADVPASQAGQQSRRVSARHPGECALHSAWTATLSIIPMARQKPGRTQALGSPNLRARHSPATILTIRCSSL